MTQREHDLIVYRLCEAVKQPSCFHELLDAENIVESDDLKEGIRLLAVRLYHYEEGGSI